jgi:hypothetical protein
LALGDDGASDGISRRLLRDTRSSLPRPVTLAVTLGEPMALTAAPERSVGLPSVIAAAEAAMTTPATRSADIRGTTLEERRMRGNFGTMELFGSSRSDSGSACLPDKIQTFRRQQAGTDATERCSQSVKLIWSLRGDLPAIFSPFGGPARYRIVRHIGAVRRSVNLDRSQLITLLGFVPDPTHAACQAELTAGATFRVHDGTVSRESVLRTYSARVPATATHEAMRRLAMCAYPQLRLGAVSGSQRFVLFLDPDAHQVVACLGVPT